MSEATVIKEVRKKLDNIPVWVYWAIALFGIGAIVVFIVYLWYQKRKETKTE